MPDKQCGTCSKNDVLLFACSGGSNVAQIANDAVVQLDQEGVGRMYCAMGVAAKLPSFMDTISKASVKVDIDGCEVHCLKHVFEAAGIPLDVHITVTDHNIIKGHHFNVEPVEIDRILSEFNKEMHKAISH